jgi:hypothetical protein
VQFEPGVIAGAGFTGLKDEEESIKTMDYG